MNDNNLYKMFIKQAKINPDAIAAKCNGLKLTYKELMTKVENISPEVAKYLPKHGPQLIGICFQSNIDALVAILTILKIGAGYVPIDPEYPNSRISYIIEDAQLPCILTNKSTLKSLTEKTRNLAHFDKFITLKKNIKQKNKTPQTKNACKLAYVIYTSGSTGKPKGVMVQQSNVINYAKWVKEYLDIIPNDVFDCSSSFAFDLTVTVSLIPLIFGGTVSLCSKKRKLEPSKYLGYLAKERISIAKMTPSYFNLLCDHLTDKHQLPCLKTIILGGENPSLKHIQQWLLKFPKHHIVNEYGPTETTVGVTQETITFDNVKDLSYLPLGVPGHNVTLSVRDACGKETKRGEVGELYIGGKCVTSGYLNRHVLTSDKFTNGYYKTGDLVRVHDKDKLEYIGRADNQIKLRGYRIELGEIENQMLKFAGITQAIVKTHKTENNEYLIGYYTKGKNTNIDIGEFRAFLSNMLPEYMVPSKFIALNQFHVTVNGKIDRDKLPDPSFCKYRRDIKQKEDCTTVRSTINEIWGNLTGIQITDEHRNFFEMGGNSLLMAIFCKKLAEKGININIAKLFEFPTIESLSNHIENKNIIYQPQNNALPNRNFSLLQNRYCKR